MAVVATEIINMINTAIQTTSYNITDITSNSSSSHDSYPIHIDYDIPSIDSIPTTSLPTTSMPQPAPNSTGFIIQHPIKIVVTSIQLLLVLIGTINLLVIYVIISRPYIRSITNVYLACLCISNFVYLSNLTFVVATQLNDKSWPFGQFLCTTYHSMESTSKYSSVLFVVLLSIDRYIVMCCGSRCRRYRNYRIAIIASVIAVFVAILASLPLFIFSGIVYHPNGARKLCVVKWPTINSPTWYISFTSVLIFGIPSCLIVFTYFHVYRKLKEGLKGIKRLKCNRRSCKSYQRVTTFVLWTILFHTICWCPFWFFNLISAIFHIQIATPAERIVLNMIHLLPYMNCALNPIVYAANAKNFRKAFCSVFNPGLVKEKSTMKRQAAVIIRKRDSDITVEKKLFMFGTQDVQKPTIHHIVQAAAGCAEVAGVELELTCLKDEECFTGEVEMIVPEIHWEVETPSSDEATEGATQENSALSPSLMEALSRPLSTLSRTFSNPMDQDSGIESSQIPNDRKDSRRHTMSHISNGLSNGGQFLLVPFSVQLAKGRGSCSQLSQAGK